MSDHIARTEKQLGAIVRRARRRAGLTQSGLRDLVHLRQGTISRLEAGEPALQLHTLMVVLAALKLEVVIRDRTQADANDLAALF